MARRSKKPVRRRVVDPATATVRESARGPTFSPSTVLGGDCPFVVTDVYGFAYRVDPRAGTWRLLRAG